MYRMELGKERLSEMMRFVVVGLIATAINYAVYYVMLPFMNASAAFTTGYIVSFLCNYAMSSKFTFRVGTSLQRFVSFGVSHATNYFIQIILLNLVIGLGISDTLAPLPVYAMSIPISYLNVRFALKRNSREADNYWLFLMVVGFAMLWLNLLDAPTLSDDMIYRFMWNADPTAPVETIDGLGDLMRSQWAHYLTQNGRFVPHLLAQTFLVFVPAVVLQVLNTLLFVLMIHLSATWACKDIQDRLAAAAVACMLLFVVFSGFRTAMLWGLGTLNYLWPIVAVLTLTHILQKIDGDDGKKRLYAFPVMLLAIVVGWTHEALSLPVSVAFATWIVLHRRNLCDHKFVLVSMLLFMAGTTLCLLSPGIWGRAGDATSFLSRMISGAVNCVSNIRVTWLLAIALLLTWRRDRKAVRHHFATHRYEYAALAAALGIVLLCGVSLERVAFFADFIAMLLLTEIVLKAVSQRKKLWLTVGCCVLMLIAYVPAYMVRNENVEAWQLADEQMRAPGRELIAVKMPVKGKSKVMDYFREHYANSSFEFGFYCCYMGFDAKDSNMRCAAKLYGKERLTFLPDDVVNRIESDSTAYSNYELDRNGDLYIWRMNDNQPVTAVTFVLKDEDTSKLLPHQRLLAYHDDTYELDDFHFEVVNVCQRPYLVFTKPTTNIYRRIDKIEIKHY